MDDIIDDIDDEISSINKMFENEFKQCEECYKKVNIMIMCVKETVDGQCIYCPQCVEHHKFLEKEEKRMAKLWNIDLIKYGKEIEKKEKRISKLSVL